MALFNRYGAPTLTPEQQAQLDQSNAATAQQQQLNAEREGVHQDAVQSFVNKDGSNLGTYGYIGSAGYDPYESSSTRPDQSNAERIEEQIQNYQYGGYAEGASDAQAAAREAVDSNAYNLGRYGSEFMGQSSAGAGVYGMGVGGLYGTAADLSQYAQQGPGPSVAQAQLAANTAANQRFALAQAGSERGQGGGASAFRQALAQNAQTQGAANAQASMLQAQEAQDWRQAQLAAYGQAGAMYGQGAGLGGDYATGMGQLATGAQQAGGELALGGEQLANQIAGTALSGSQAYEGNITDIYSINKGIGAGPSDEMTTKDWINAGLQTASTAGSLYAQSGSDIRAKTNIQPTSALDAVSDAGSYSYNYLDPQRHGQGTYVGPMAQELEGAPGVVGQDADGTKNIDTGRLALLNTSALSELNDKVDALAGIDGSTSEFASAGTPSDFNPYEDMEVRPTPRKAKASKALPSDARPDAVRAAPRDRARDVDNTRFNEALFSERAGELEAENNRFNEDLAAKRAAEYAAEQAANDQFNTQLFEQRIAEEAARRAPAPSYAANIGGAFQPIAGGRNIPMRNLDGPISGSPRAPLGTQFSDELSQAEQDEIERQFFDPAASYQTWAL
jgi:hypothetical protein